MDYVKYTEATLYNEYSIQKLPMDLHRGGDDLFKMEFDWQMAYSPNVSLVDKIMDKVVDNLKKKGFFPSAHLIPGGKIYVYLWLLRRVLGLFIFFFLGGGYFMCVMTKE